MNGDDGFRSAGHAELRELVDYTDCGECMNELAGLRGGARKIA